MLASMIGTDEKASCVRRSRRFRLRPESRSVPSTDLLMDITAKQIEDAGV